MLEHKHLILKGEMQRPLFPKDVQNWLKKLVKGLDMQLILSMPVNPMVAYQGGDNPGVTGVGLITTSHIVIHTWDNDLNFQLDVYSCKKFEPKYIKEMALEIGLLTTESRFFDRKYDIIDDEQN